MGIKSRVTKIIKIPMSKDILEQLYFKEELSFLKISKRYEEIYGVSVNNVTVKKWFLGYGLVPRSRKEDQEIAARSKTKPVDLSSFENMTIGELAKINDVSTTTIHKKLKKQKIYRERTPKETSDIRFNKFAKEVNVSGYVDGKSKQLLAEENNCSYKLINRALKINGIKERTRNESQLIANINSVDTCIEKYGVPYSFYKANKTGSIAEKEIKDWLNDDLGFNFQQANNFLPIFLSGEDRISHQQLDGLDRDKMVAFEYCGLYAHSRAVRKDKFYHLRKHKKCDELGIKLYTIFENEWSFRKDQVKGLIKTQLGLIGTRVYARNTKFIEIPPYKAKLLCNNWHIQGAPSNISKAFGLEYDGKIISIMTFGMHHRNNIELTLNRYCFDFNYYVIGGVEKMFSNAINVLDVSKIKTWSDNRYTNGNLYNKLGFSCVGEVLPDYILYNGNSHKIKKKQGSWVLSTDRPTNMSVEDYEISLKWYRVYDAGKLTWEWKK
jgi:hypothetical protein